MVKRLTWKLVGLAWMLTLTACTTASGSFCDISKPIRPSEAEIAALSDERVQDILEHNTKGQRLCGWRP